MLWRQCARIERRDPLKPLPEGCRDEKHRAGTIEINIALHRRLGACKAANTDSHAHYLPMICANSCKIEQLVIAILLGEHFGQVAWKIHSYIAWPRKSFCTYVTAIHASKKSLSKKRMSRSCFPEVFNVEEGEDVEAIPTWAASASFDDISIEMS